MKIRMIVALALGVAGATAFGAAQAQTEAAWGTLINGTNGLENFEQAGNANWRVMEDGIGANLGNGHLVTKESYKTSELSPRSGSTRTPTAASSSAARIRKSRVPTAATR